MIIELKWKKRICILTALLAAGILTAYAGIRREQKMQKELAGNVLRFHVIANSNSKRDQELKLRVKEQIIQYMKEEIPTSDSVEQTRRWAKTHLIEIEDRAKEFLRVQGCNLPVKACVADSYFPEKTYGDITFPPGNYEALRIEIGAANGENWWCVLYPNLCFIDAVHAVVPEEGKKQLRNVLEEDTYQLVTAKPKFRIKWFFFR